MKYYQDLIKYKKNVKQQKEEQTIAHEKSIDQIKLHKNTEVIRYPQYKEAFEYVDNKFPDADIKSATIYRCDRRYLDKIGYKNIGGFFSRVKKIIVIPNISASFKSSDKKTIWHTLSATLDVDDILVHEMCHYVSDTRTDTWKTILREEEFAYGNSAPYLRAKGHSDDWIIDNNFMPFLIMAAQKEMNYQYSSTRTEEEEQKIFDDCLERARAIGKDILRIWDEKSGKSSDESIDVIRPKLDMDWD